MRKVSSWEVLFVPLFFLLILYPILAILGNVTLEGMVRTFGDPIFWDAVKNTLATAFFAALLGVLMALGFAYFYIFHPGTIIYKIADFMNDLPIALPHTVAGLALLLAFGRNMFGFVGPTGIAFTLVAVVLAMFFVSYPLAARTIASSAEEIDKELISVARTLGDSPPQAYRRVVIPLLGEAIFSGFVLAFSRSLSEFAAVIMFGGNVPGMTQVLASYVFTKVEEGEVSMAVTASAFCILLSLMLVLFLRLKGRLYARSAESA
jgi:molybdate transport system permease protein